MRRLYYYWLLKKKVKKLSGQINAPDKFLPTFRYSLDGAHPHIEIDKLGYFHYVVIERGQESKRKTTDNLNDILYWIFEYVTFIMAVKYELKNRVENKDTRRLLFDYQEKLLQTLNKEWSQRCHEEHAKILKDFPFVD